MKTRFTLHQTSVVNDLHFSTWCVKIAKLFWNYVTHSNVDSRLYKQEYYFLLDLEYEKKAMVANLSLIFNNYFAIDKKKNKSPITLYTLSVEKADIFTNPSFFKKISSYRRSKLVHRLSDFKGYSHWCFYKESSIKERRFVNKKLIFFVFNPYLNIQHHSFRRPSYLRLRLENYIFYSNRIAQCIRICTHRENRRTISIVPPRTAFVLHVITNDFFVFSYKHLGGCCVKVIESLSSVDDYKSFYSLFCGWLKRFFNDCLKRSLGVGFVMSFVKTTMLTYRSFWCTLMYWLPGFLKKRFFYYQKLISNGFPFLAGDLSCRKVLRVIQAWSQCLCYEEAILPHRYRRQKQLYNLFYQHFIETGLLNVLRAGELFEQSGLYERYFYRL